MTGCWVAGRIARWKSVQEELKDAVLKYAIDSTKAWFSIWICRGERGRFDFRMHFLHFFATLSAFNSVSTSSG